MTRALEEAVQVSQTEALFKGAYDPELGFLLWYDVPGDDPSREKPSHGLDITCFEANIADGACSAYFP